MGTTVLMGGNEFRPSCRSMDELLLQRSAKTRPNLVILPTAAAHEDPQLAVANGMRYFQALGAHTSAAMVVTRQDADNPGIIEPIRHADIIYLTGGNPTYLLNTLRDSAAWAAILERWREGAMVIGSSAGAMVMGGQMQAGGTLVPALGLARRLAIWPHHRANKDAAAPTGLAELGEDLMALGIAEATACYSVDDIHWQVIGVGAVVAYSTTDTRLYRSGQSFRYGGPS